MNTRPSCVNYRGLSISVLSRAIVGPLMDACIGPLVHSLVAQRSPRPGHHSLAALGTAQTFVGVAHSRSIYPLYAILKLLIYPLWQLRLHRMRPGLNYFSLRPLAEMDACLWPLVRSLNGLLQLSQTWQFICSLDFFLQWEPPWTDLPLLRTGMPLGRSPPATRINFQPGFK